MIKIQDLDRAMFDDTSTLDFEVMLKQYYIDNPVNDDSKQRFKSIVANLQQQKLDE